MSSESSERNWLAPTVQHIENCAISSWYDKFRSVTIRTKLIELPETFLAYLHADGLVMPKGVHAAQHQQSDEDEDDDKDQDQSGEEYAWVREWKQKQLAEAALEGSEHGSEDSEPDEDDRDDAQEEADTPEFPELVAQLESAIAELGGSVFPKLNWSAPRVSLTVCLNFTSGLMIPLIVRCIHRTRVGLHVTRA